MATASPSRTAAGPRVKPIYPVFRERDGVVTIGAQLGLSRSFADPRGHVWETLRQCDGTRSEAEILAAVRTRFPELTAQDLTGFLGVLDSMGFLEPEGVAELLDDPTVAARFVGNINYATHFQRRSDVRGSAQERLARSSVLLLGLGGGGSMILQLLCGLGLGHITGVDGDTVEASNLNRQLIFTTGDIGRPKAEVAREYAQARVSGTTLTFVSEFATTAERVAELARGHDLIICAADEPAGQIHRIVSAAAVAVGIPALFGASQVSRGRLFTIVPGRTGCVDCLFVHYNDADPHWAERFRNFWSSGFSPPTLAFGPNIARISAELADEAARILAGHAPPRTLGAQWELNYETGAMAPLLDWQREADCPTCGTGDRAEYARMLGDDEPMRVPEG